MHKQPDKPSFFEKLATAIVDRRNLIFFLYLCALIFSLFSQGWVKVCNDLTQYLPENTETRQGLTIMEDEFITYGTARIMLSNVTYDMAANLAAELASIDGVTSVSFGNGTEQDTPEEIAEYFKGSDALLSVTFDGEETDPISLSAMEEIKQRGTTILMVTHDMGSIIKYCDKVVLLNKGEFIAEGEPGHMVDLYKKILANQLDSLNEELESDYSGGMLGDEKKAKAEESHSDGSLMKDKITINTDRTEYGDGRAEIFDLGLFDAKGNLTNLLLKGEMFTIKERIRFHAPLKCPIFTYTIKDKKGTDLSGTNTMYEGADVKPVNEGDVYDVSFTQKMTLQGGEYLLSMSCTGFEGEEHVVYHRLYDVANITVISNKNTVGVYDMESQVEAKYVKA